MINFTEILKIRNVAKLYDYQEKAIAEIDKGKNLIVSTPTASGKMLLAEYGIIRVLETHLFLDDLSKKSNLTSFGYFQTSLKIAPKKAAKISDF